ncbi:MAG: endonuclease III [candidate division Zixibacteria bacterium]|nr:endonuclease III [candidate division Zixibacteria bacterium]
MPVEVAVKIKVRTQQIVERLKVAYPDSKCSLDFKTTHQLLVATILSAQCTDERVNRVTPALFKKYRSVKAFAEADMEALQQDIFATGFYVNKAKAIKNSAKQLVAEYKSRIPRSITELTKLPGVGRKTASVILGVGYGIAEGIVVDTHVGRIAGLLGLTKQKNAVKIERDLIELVPPSDWIIFSHLMIDHGRAVCIARRPKCGECTLAKLCPSAILG